MALDKLTTDMITDGTIVATNVNGALGSGSQWVRTNTNSISQNITIPSGTNAMSVGPMSLSVGNTITCNGVYRVI